MAISSVSTVRGFGLTASRLVTSSRPVQWLAWFLLWFLGATVVGMLALPWQQTAKGTGRVVAYVPQERQQTVQAQMKGVVSRVAPGIVEGSTVTAGQVILEITPQAADLREQLQAQMGDLKSKRDTAQAKAAVYAKNVEVFQEARDFAIRAATELVQAAEAKWKAKQDLVAGYESKEWQARRNYERQKRLAEQGIRATQEIEKYRKEWEVAKAELESVKGDVEALAKELASKQHELEEKRRIAQTYVEKARADEQEALGQVAQAQKEIRELEIKLSELDRLVITAPRNGTIFRMPVYENGQAVKEGDDLFTIVPESSQRAVELWLSGNDTPLVRIGDHVRLQFEGWPAIQFAGWPSIARGTFGGTVISIDATDDGKGKFRLLVGPDGKEPWPSNHYLRQGVRAHGWVLLRQVSLGFEIWRQLNGFPPIRAMEEPKEEGATKAPKLPK